MRVSRRDRPGFAPESALSPPNGGIPAGQLEITGLRCETTLGVAPEERVAPRQVSVDIKIALDLAAAAESDALADTVDWAALCEALRTLARQSSSQLAESLCGALLDATLGFDERILEAEVAVHKTGALPGGADAAVRLRRAKVGWLQR